MCRLFATVLLPMTLASLRRWPAPAAASVSFLTTQRGFGDSEFVAEIGKWKQLERLIRQFLGQGHDPFQTFYSSHKIPSTCLLYTSSGSGPTVFGLVKDEETACRLKEKLRETFSQDLLLDVACTEEYYG